MQKYCRIKKVKNRKKVDTDVAEKDNKPNPSNLQNNKNKHKNVLDLWV